jgi:lipoprotein-releasing system ATP-binding protein
MNKPVIECRELSKIFAEAENPVTVLQTLDFSIASNESVAILGQSGSGKSTLLHLLGGLDKPTSGEVFWQGQSVAALSERDRCKLRNEQLGFVYQFHHLLPEFSAIENVAMPLLIRGQSLSAVAAQAEQLLEKVGLQSRASHKPSQLSGGERQRVAIARALITKPACVLADEPTGNLDQATAQSVLDVMLNLKEDLGTSFVVVTHNEHLASCLDRCFSLEQGKLT